MADQKFDHVVQLRLSDRQHRYLLLAAATENGSQKYAPIVRDLIDQAIANSDPKWRKLLDRDDFGQVLAENL
jgi:hypothetical protein